MLDSDINMKILTTNDITVVLYFFLLLFKFLLAITPPIPNIFFVRRDVLSFLAFVFISLFPLIDSIGEIFDALIAGIRQDRYIVINEITIVHTIASGFMLYIKLKFVLMLHQYLQAFHIVCFSLLLIY